MSPMLRKTSLFSVSLTLAAILFSAEGSGAAAQNPQIVSRNFDPAQTTSQPADQPVLAPAVEVEVAPSVSDSTPALAPNRSLRELVAAQSTPGALSPELRCLAGAIYFESKSEPLEGQYAVGRVIVARSKSGRYPGSYCGVIYQPSQFSFVHGHAMPAINTGSTGWHEAVAIAQLADAGTWHSPVEGALSFHATRVSPGWHMTRVARLGNHVFYR